MIRQVDGDVWEASYKCGLYVLFLKSNGYINVTDIHYGIGYEIWKTLDMGIKLIGFLKHEFSKDVKDFELEKTIIRRQGFDGVNYSGKYIHPSLIPHITLWAAPQHAAYMHRICLLTSDQSGDFRERNKEFEFLNSSLSNKLGKLKTEQYKQIQSIINFVEKHPKDDEQLLDKLTKLANNVGGEQKSNRHRRPPTHSFTIIRLNTKTNWNYFALECKRKQVSKAIEKLKFQYPKATTIFQQLHVPNNVNVRNLIMEDGTVTLVENYCSFLIGENKFLNLMIQFCKTDVKPNILAIYDETDCNVYTEIL